MSNEKQLCTFFVGDLFLGVEVERVQEVIRHQHSTRVPLAPAVVRGLINLRGQIVTAVDLRERLELGGSTNPEPMNVVVRTEDGAVSLLVDEIGEVEEVDASVFDPVPDTLNGVGRDLLKGVYKLDKRLLLHLDAEKAVEIA